MADPLHSDQVKATLYGNCIGDAMGLLTEFMVKDEAKTDYKEHRHHLELEHRVQDSHRMRWAIGDWTDDSDQMILIMLSLISQQGQVDPVDFARRMNGWRMKGFPELGDLVGMGIGEATNCVIKHHLFLTNPHQAATEAWEATDRQVAANGAVMRTSVLGLHCWWDTAAVTEQAKAICQVTHADPRCQASCVAVTTAISLMLQRQPQHVKRKGTYNVKQIIKDSYAIACKACLSTKEEKSLLWEYMSCRRLSSLKLDEAGKIGYTYKCLGAGFWAFKQKDFREAIEKLLMEAGDADTNCAVAGALLGCKLGLSALPPSWLEGLKHKAWLDGHIEQFLRLERRLFLEQCPEKVPDSLKEAILEDHAAESVQRSENVKEDVATGAAAAVATAPDPASPGKDDTAVKSEGAEGQAST